MSEIEDLAEVADQTAFARGNSRFGVPGHGGRPRLSRCGSPDHMKGPNIRVYRNKGKVGKLRTVCRLCDKARRDGKPTYSAQGYPL